MIARMKKTRFGKAIHRLSRLPLVGFPSRVLSRLLQSEAIYLGHLRPGNLAHNRQQIDALRRFEENLE